MKRSLTALRSHRARYRRDHRHRNFCADRHGGGRRTNGRFDLENAAAQFRNLLDQSHRFGHLAGRGRDRRSSLSFVVAAIACGFAALCYAELAAMIPVSGSAYTYSYATLGEIIAWIIGWDLILEYAVGNMAVAVGWSGYFVKLCGSLFGLKFPLWAVTDYKTAPISSPTAATRWLIFRRPHSPSSWAIPLPLICPRFLIVAVVTILLIYGIRESATRQHDDRNHEGRGRRVLHRVRLVHGESDELAPFHAPRVSRSDERCGHCLFCLHRFRRRLDHRGGNTESATRHADRDDRQPD